MAFKIIVWLLLLVGAYLIITSVIPISNSNYAKTIKKYKSNKATNIITSSSGIDRCIEKLTAIFSKYIFLDELRKAKLKKSLHLNDNPKTPEEYLSYTYTVSAFLVLLGLLSFIFSTFIGSVLIAFAVINYIYNIKKLESNTKKALIEIENELPRFVSYIKQTLKTNNNAVLLLENYKSSNTIFNKEINITLADIKTSNFDTALVRMDNRICSDKLRMIINGLQGVFHGDDVIFYFAMLEKDFTTFEINELKKAMKKIPQKMQIPKMLLYLSIALVLFTPLLLQIIDSFKELFS